MNRASLSMADEAAEWVAHMDRAAWSNSDEEALTRWLDADPRRSGALLQAQAAWQSLAICVDTADAEPRRGWSRRDLLLTGAGAMAASLAGGVLWLRNRGVYSTALGEIRRLPLADGSIATVNTASQIEVRLARQSRDIRIDQGEVWFDVAKDAARPFTVEAGGVRVRAVGTAFSVRRHAHGVDVLVNEGVVETWAADADGHRVRLAAGQRAFVAENAAIQVIPSAPSEIDRALAWRSGLMELSGDTLGEAIDGINRYNRRKLVLVDQRLAGERFDGVYQLADPEGFAVAVHHSLLVPVDVTDPDTIRIGEAR